MTYRSRLLGIGMSVPSRVVTNHELATSMETSHDWIVERTGIEERRWVSEGETGASMATAASKQAIERSGIALRDIDNVTGIFVTHRMRDAFTLASEYASNGNGDVVFHREGQDMCISNTRFLLLREGQIFFEGPDELLRRSKDPYIQRFLA